MNKTSALLIRSLLLGTSCLSVFAASGALADPTGGNVVYGSATITSNGGNSTVIDQKTGKAIINWNTFSIAAGGTVRFNQPGSGSIALNRVLGSESSAIYGSLLANGQVWLINANGILFGGGSKINVGGLIATTSDIANGDFAAGNYNFNGGTGAPVVNDGTIRAKNGGSVVLSGASVQNRGLVAADAGTVVLGGASAFTVDFVGDGLIKYAITAPAAKADGDAPTGVSNSGTISANGGGRVLMTARAAADVADAVVNNTGMISATSAKLQNGEVVLDGGDGDVSDSGSIDVSGVRAGQTGGSVAITGRNIAIADGATIAASGDSGGGTVLIGGDAHGGGTLAHAANVHVGNATVTADATRRGNGGKLVVWSNGLTDFSGVFSALGGDAGGNGGFVETSGHTLSVGTQAHVDTRAPHGATGTWLLDPQYIIIANSGTTPIIGGTLALDQDSEDTDTVSPAAIITALSTTNVSLQASNAIQIEDAVIYNSANSLSLLSQGSITVGADIQNSGSGDINLIAGWDGTTTSPANFADAGVYGIGEGSGYIEFSNDAAVGSFGGTTTFAADSVVMGIYGTHTQIGYKGAEGGGGDIKVLTTGDLSLSIYNGGTVQIGNGSIYDAIDADVTGNVTITAGGTLNLTEYSGTIIMGSRASEGHVATSNFTLTAADRNESGNALNDSIEGDIVGGDVSITVQSNLSGIGPLSYTSDHTLSLSTQGDLNIDHAITNLGTGAIELTADGNITQNPANCFGAAITAAALDATSTGGDVTLDDQGNAIASASLSAAGNVTLINSTDITLTSVFAGGSVYVSTDFEGAESGAITIDGQITAVGGDGCEGACIDLEAVDGVSETANGLLTGTGLYVSSETGDITLNNEANSIDGEVQLRAYDEAGNVSFVDSEGFTLEGSEAGGTFSVQSTNGGILIDDEVDAGGAMTLTAQGDIGETSYGDLEGGDLSVTSSAGSIDLFDGDNDLGGTVSLNAFGDVKFYNDDDLTLGASSAGGQFYVEAFGAVTQTGAITAGSLAVETDCIDDCSDASVTLDDQGNTIGGDVAFNTGGDVTFVDSIGFNLGRVILDGREDHTYVGGDLTVTALTGGIVINGGVETNLNDFLGGGPGCGCGDPTLTAAGDITETQDGYITGGDLNVTSIGGSISLLGDNDLIGTVSLHAFGDVYFGNDDDTVLGESSAGGTMFIGSFGDLTQTGAITATNLAVSAASATLDNADNNVTGNVAFQTDNDVTFVDAAGFTLADVALSAAPDPGTFAFANDIGGELTATSLNGGITIDGQVLTGDSGEGCGCNDPVLTAAGDIVETENGSIVGGDLSVTSTGGNILLVNANNDLTGTVSLSALGNASFANDTDITLGATSVGGDLLVLSQGNISIVNSIQNSGTGAITLVAGWDGLYDPSRLGAFGTYGQNDGSITIGGATAAGNVAVGSAGGAVHLYGSSLTLDAEHGYAQLGYHGAGGGDIFVRMTNDINGVGTSQNGFALQLGNGTLINDVVGNVTGNISLDAGGQTAFFDVTSVSWLGNRASAGFKASGNLTSLSTSGSYDANYLDADLGTSADTGGDVFIGFRNNPDAQGFRVGGFDYTSPHSFVFATAASLDVIGSVINHGTGDVTLVAGWDSETVGSGADIRAAGAYGLNGTHLNIGGNHHYQIGDFQFDNNQFQDISVGSAGGHTTVLGGDITIAPAAGYSAQIGYRGATGGDISLAATGDLTLIAGANAHDYAMIGNGSRRGDVSGNITGNIDIAVAGTTSLHSTPGGGQSWIGNFAASGFAETGNVQLVTFDIDGSSNGLGAMIAADLNGGDVLIGVTDTASVVEIDDSGAYNSAHTLSLLSAGSFDIETSILNAGTGAINIVAGWDGATLDAAHFADAGVFGNNNGAITIGGAQAAGNVAVGSAGGQTNLAASAITLVGVNGYAQVGYHGLSTGSVTLNALGAVTLVGGSAADYAQIGSGTVFGSNAAGGDVSVSAASIGASSNTAVAGNTVKLAAASGGIGASGSSLRIASASLALKTNGGAVFLVSPGNAVSFGPVSLAGGSLTISAAGPITQTAAIHTGNLTISTTAGAITLTNAANMFGGLTVTTTGSDNATFAHASFIGVTSANVGGTLSLSAAGNISQTGAIHAAGLSVSSSGGAITLTNSGNSFATLNVATAGSNAASLVDASAVTLTGANVGGSFTLAAGGAIGQSAAIHTGALSVSTTSGAIVLNNAANTFTSLTVVTHGTDNASVAHAGNLVVAGVTVGGTLTLAAGGVVNQTGAILAGGLVVSSGGVVTLTNSANSFATLSLTTSAGNNASVFDASAVTLGGVTVGGSFTLAAGGAIGQTGAIVASALTVSTTSGAITLSNSGNSFATLSVATAGSDDASIADSTALTLAGATVGGKLTLAAGGPIGQTGAIVAHALTVSSTAGAITLANAANAVAGTVQLATPGAAIFANSVATNVGTTAVGGDLTLLSKGNVNFFASVQSVTGNVTVVAGWDGTTTNAALFGNAGVYGNANGNITIGGTGATGNVAVGSKAGTTSLYASNVNIMGANGYAQLGYHGTGGGAIKLAALHNLTLSGGSGYAMIGNGSFGSDVTGNVTGDIDIRVGGSAIFNSVGTAMQAWIGNKTASGSETGNLILLATDSGGSQVCDLGCFAQADIVGGDVTLGVTSGTDQTIDGSIVYNSAHTLNLLIGGGLAITGSLQNAGTGAINLVTGWDGHTLSNFGAAGVYGNNAKGVVIGGATAAGNAAFGSAGGTTSIYGASLVLSAVNGYAQLGYNGHGAGAIAVNVTGNVTLTGGSGAGQFAQIGNGGLKTSGNNSGAIAINAGGDVVLTGGAGTESYVQIGHGGAESNTGANGYSNVAAITVNATNVTLQAGLGSAAYVQIGNGGYKSGLNLAGGTAVNGGNITITAGHAVSLLGNGADAYAQIGNGGSQSNLNAAAAAGGTDSGNIIVHAPNGGAGSVTLTSGAGANAYSQIGNGGYAVNSGPTSTVANWTVTGNVTVTDLALTGGNGGSNAYSQIGNGDASHTAYANVSGDITIDANGQITYTSGTAPHSIATIGNFTGQGTVSGSISGDTPPPPPELANDPSLIGVVVGDNPKTGQPGDGIPPIATIVINDGEENNGGATTVLASLGAAKPGPLAELAGNGSDSSTPNTADSATVIIADSLDGARQASSSQSILAGMLKQTGVSNGVHGVPPADQDFSSWGNEALWQ